MGRHITRVRLRSAITKRSCGKTFIPVSDSQEKNQVLECVVKEGTFIEQSYD